MDHRAHTTRTGWKNSRIRRAWSVSRPKASVPVTYWEMLPGKIATKNAATIQPTGDPVPGQRDERQAEDDLDDARGHHDEVRVEGHPRGHLGLERLALVGEVTDAGEQQERPEDDPRDRPWQ